LDFNQWTSDSEQALFRCRQTRLRRRTRTRAGPGLRKGQARDLDVQRNLSSDRGLGYPCRSTESIQVQARASGRNSNSNINRSPRRSSAQSPDPFRSKVGGLEARPGAMRNLRQTGQSTFRPRRALC